MGHEDAFPPPTLERPLSVQSRDLREDAGQWARRADIRPSRRRPEWRGLTESCHSLHARYRPPAGSFLEGFAPQH
jgi:hypothetical protein